MSFMRTIAILSDAFADAACEVLSPSTMTFDKAVKLPVYALEGVGHLWHVDPDAGILEAFELQDGRWGPAQSADRRRTGHPVAL